MNKGRGMLPVGVQTFRKIRDSGDFYVDKTAFAAEMIAEGAYYFLSRPRRFGKSVFLDTLKELFEGSEELFRGLAVHSGWDWSERHPVVRLGFGRGNYKDPSYLSKNIHAQLDAAQEDAEVSSDYTEPPDRFAHLLRLMHRRSGRRVVVLVDEYDKPILDALGDPETADRNRDFLRGFYSTLKDSDAHVRFVFFTGVSKFSKVGLFSGLNNLRDITLDPAYSAMCGFTEEELDRVFAAQLEGLDRKRIRAWYNGYSWLGSERVYNPYDVLLLLKERKFKAHWFETGTPGFLVERLLDRSVPSMSLGDMAASEDMLWAFDVDDIATEALLFQTGYLTIVGEEDLGGLALYRLDYPNREVRQGLNKVLLRYLVQDIRRQTANSISLQQLLRDGDAEGLRALFHAFYASIPHDWYRKNKIARFEGYYASVFYSYFAALGLDVAVEDSTSQGRVDMAVRCGERAWLFEFKVAEASQPGEGLRQMRERDYADKYRSEGVEVVLVAVEFSRETRNITGFETAIA